MEKDPNRAPACDQSQCVLPDCFCSPDGTQIPGKLEPNQVPQMIMITFDDAINNNNIDIYEKIFKEGRNNPNGCAIKVCKLFLHYHKLIFLFFDLLKYLGHLFHFPQVHKLLGSAGDAPQGP